MISAIVLAKDEEANLDRCLASLQGLQEVIVYDDESTDKTTAIAKKYGATVITHASHQDFAAQRNAAMKAAKYDWVLFVDADEELSAGLQKELSKLQNEITSRNDIAYRIKRADIWWGQKLTRGEVYTAAHTGIIRLVNRTQGTWQGKVHEEFKTDGNVGTLDHEIIHRPHPTVTSFLEHINEYSSMRADELAKQGKRTNIFELIIYPFFKFLYNYILKAGYVEGAAGFSYAFFMSFHSFLVRSKLYVTQYKATHTEV
ncbi:MAG: glycosyltransferase family 2 protein [Weeksellaceae bacterium]